MDRVKSFDEATTTVMPAQAEFLAKNTHLVPVERLADGDLLVLDRGEWGANWKGTPLEDTHLGPYILTTACEVQCVTDHYQVRHSVSL